MTEKKNSVKAFNSFNQASDSEWASNLLCVNQFNGQVKFAKEKRKFKRNRRKKNNVLSNLNLVTYLVEYFKVCVKNQQKKTTKSFERIKVSTSQSTWNRIEYEKNTHKNKIEWKKNVKRVHRQVEPEWIENTKVECTHIMGEKRIQKENY